MSFYRTKVQELDAILNQNEIKLKDLGKICFHGIPDSQGRRALCWRLLLNYLPVSKKEWNETLNRSRNLYKQFIEEMIVTPGASDNNCTDDVTLVDHPLSLNPDSKWQTFFKDNEVLSQIDKDVRRLCPDISFFQQACDFPCEAVVQSKGVKRLHKRVQRTVLKSANVERRGLGVTRIALSVKKAIEDYAPLDEGSEAHWEVVERILFLYAKLNPGQGYVQGMNEIIGPIYYAFASDPDSAWREHAEADCFFCFTNLMAEIRDFFIKSLDEAECGIKGMMIKLSQELKKNDFQVWSRLKQQELCPEYYSFRWITLLLSQEFPLPDVLRIWDSLFSYSNRFDFLIHVCCSMIILLREHILNNEFSANVKILQNFPPTDVHIILSKAAELAAENKS